MLTRITNWIEKKNHVSGQMKILIIMGDKGDRYAIVSDS